VSRASLNIHPSKTQILVELQGDWRALTLSNISAQLKSITLKKGLNVHFSIAKIHHIDSAGALILTRYLQYLKERHIHYSIIDEHDNAQFLIKEFLSHPAKVDEKINQEKTFSYFLEAIGLHTVHLWYDLQEMLAFLGEVMIAFGHFILQPFKFRFKIFLNTFQHIAIHSLPIVGTISFLIGVVLAYQGINQLRRFGAEIFTVDLLAVSILRELGVLITSIVIAGRSGSAFTAQISYMKLNQEVDAMRILGLNPVHVLVLPRIMALMFALPFLTFIADILGLYGGAIMICLAIDLPLEQFLEQLRLSLTKWTFWTGMIKAPVFAFIIGFIGCLEGLRAGGGAENVGLQTTRSVVESIFLVIVLDAFFSIVFSYIGI